MGEQVVSNCYAMYENVVPELHSAQKQIPAHYAPSSSICNPLSPNNTSWSSIQINACRWIRQSIEQVVEVAKKPGTVLVLLVNDLDIVFEC